MKAGGDEPSNNVDLTRLAVGQSGGAKRNESERKVRGEIMEWQPIETAPKDKSVLLYCNKYVPIYYGRKRYGTYGEPSQDSFEWRCDSSGRYATPKYWMPLPEAPNG